MSRILAAIACLAAASGCAPLDAHGITSTTSTTSAAVGVDGAQQAASPGRYRTFSFGPAEAPPEGYTRSLRAAELRQPFEKVVADELRRMGYVEVPVGGDFLVEIGMGRRVLATYGVSSLALGRSPSDADEVSTEGTVVVDAFDATRGDRLWHGVMRTMVRGDLADEPRIERDLAALLATFPKVPSVVVASPRQ